MFVDVYRFERVDGVGPYQLEELSAILRPHCVDGKHPAPWQDELFIQASVFDSFWEITNPDYHFGFASVAQMLDWFDDADMVSALQYHGVNLYKMTVQCNHQEDVVHGTLQTMFLKSRVVYQEQLDLEDFYNFA